MAICWASPRLSDIAQGLQHAGVHVIEQVAVEGPLARMIDVASDRHLCHGRREDGVAHGAVEGAKDGSPLEFIADFPD